MKKASNFLLLKFGKIFAKFVFSNKRNSPWVRENLLPADGRHPFERDRLHLSNVWWVSEQPSLLKRCELKKSILPSLLTFCSVLFGLSFSVDCFSTNLPSFPLQMTACYVANRLRLSVNRKDLVKQFYIIFLWTFN